MSQRLPESPLARRAGAEVAGDVTPVAIYRRRRRGTWVAAVGLAIVVIAGAAIVVWPDDDSATDPAPSNANGSVRDAAAADPASEDLDSNIDGVNSDPDVVGEAGGVEGEVAPPPPVENDPAPVEQPEFRVDAWLRPFRSDSIWNMPIGSDAEYVAAELPMTPRHFLEESSLMRTSATDPIHPIRRTSSWRNRCENPGETGRSLHLPDGWQPQAVEGNRTPNNPGVFLQPDGRTLVNVGAMARCDPTGPLYAQWPQPEMHVTDLYGDGRLGAHGASNLNQLGGAIRPGELTGDEPIRHALDLLIWSEHLHWGGSKESSYRWPATTSDSYAGPRRYRGDNADLVMGSLLALPPDVTAEGLGIDTAVGAKLFQALQDYGAYVTDDSAWDATYLGVDVEAIGTFDWDSDVVDDMTLMVSALAVVSNNSPDAVGGGGEPRQPLLPPLPTPPVEAIDLTPVGSAGAPSVADPVSPAPTIDVPAELLGEPVDAGSWLFVGGDWDADGTRLTPPQRDGVALALVGTESSDVEVDVRVSLSANRAAPGLAFRVRDESNLLAVNFVSRPENSGVFLGVLNNGVFETIAGSRAAAVRSGRDHDVRARIVGNRITVWVDQQIVLDEIVDPPLIEHLGSATAHGARVAQWADTDDGGSSYDSYRIVDV